MIILWNTSLPKDKVHTIPADVVEIFKPIPVNDEVQKLTLLKWKKLCLLILVLCLVFFNFFFWFMVFIFEVSNHFFNVINGVIYTIYNIYFFSNFCSKSSFSNGEDGDNFNVGVVVY